MVILLICVQLELPATVVTGLEIPDLLFTLINLVWILLENALSGLAPGT